MNNLIINIFKFIIGTVFGSFVTLSSIRTFTKESVVFPPSRCDHCHHQLKPWEMVPILSYLILRGHCAKCRHPIGITTFTGELFGGIIILFNPVTSSGLIEMSFEFTLLYISECDYHHYSIPTWSLILLLPVTMLQQLVTHQFSLITIFFIIIVYISTLIFNHYRPVIGNGDIDLIFILILKVNLSATLLVIMLSSLCAIIKYAIHHASYMIPYAPYLALAYYSLHLLKIT